MSAFKVTQAPGKVKWRSRRLASILVLRVARLAARLCGVKPFDLAHDVYNIALCDEVATWGDHR